MTAITQRGHHKVFSYFFFHEKLPSLAFHSPAHTILLPHVKLSYWLRPTMAYCIPVSYSISADSGPLGFPSDRNVYGSIYEFCYCMPIELPQSLRLKDLFPKSSDQFRKHLETSIFCQ